MCYEFQSLVYHPKLLKCLEISRNSTIVLRISSFLLASYGQRSDELLMSVFLAYDEVEDGDFVSYIKTKRDLWEEGKSTLTLSELLSNTENHYKTRIQKEKWNAPNKKDEEIMALKALNHQTKLRGIRKRNHSNNVRRKKRKRTLGNTSLQTKMNQKQRW
jgi:hypothetical protein